MGNGSASQSTPVIAFKDDEKPTMPSTPSNATLLSPGALLSDGALSTRSRVDSRDSEDMSPVSHVSHRTTGTTSSGWFSTASSTFFGSSRSSPEDRAEELLRFYRGVGTDNLGRYFHDMMKFTHKEMESAHNYIQWLFPTDQHSTFNSRAPCLSPELQEQFMADETIMANLRRAFDLFCGFLGFQYDDSFQSIARTSDFEKKAKVWLSTKGSQPNHNWLRCSRVLHSLSLLHELVRRDAFYAALERVYVDGLISPKLSKTLTHWQINAGIDGRGIPKQEAEFVCCSKQSTLRRHRTKAFIKRLG
eukprot:TRINITY_DN57500_c0_g1_i1.p1 TRINITY_DN57500_c0_g1~~TRINITY_DN57500_c0_g1_i1.p1  ORF type:complete len:304 (+),score=45.98 TRINITY_DN57500_c0_g1_i1:76-987(+)